MPLDIYTTINGLNPMQKEAVCQTEGPVLILAGAGSGKTRVITLRTAFLLEQGVSQSSILAVTFTNKAAKEMKDRVRKIVGKQNSCGSLVISTFHSLCLKILRHNIEHLGYKNNFTIYDTSDQLTLIRNVMSDLKHSGAKYKAEEILEEISRLKNGMEPGEKSADKDSSTYVHSVYERYQKTLKILNAVDFDDLLNLTVRLFKEHPSVLEKYQSRFTYIMVDEYQDTNRVQYSLIKQLSSLKKNLCVVGDDDQSIYGWRGADLRNIIDFEKDYPDAKIIRLEQNYRSRGNILKAANGVIKNNKNRMSKTLWTSERAGREVYIYQASTSEEEAAWVAGQISLTEFETSYTFDDFAIIYRTNKFSLPFENALRNKKIPYTVIGGTSYYERKEIKDLIAYLKVMTNPHDELALLRASNTPKRGIGTNTLSHLGDYARKHSKTLFDAFRLSWKIEEIPPKTSANIQGFIDLVSRYSKKFQTGKDMAATFHELVEEIHFKDYIMNTYKSNNASLQRIENVEDFIISLDLHEKESVSNSLTGFLEKLALTDILKNKGENAYSGVTLISFHSAKGLEFPVVFIVGVEEEIIPHKKSLLTPADLEEERRLFYVGITRGMKELYLTHTETRVKYKKEFKVAPSRFLKEIPKEVVRKFNRFTDKNKESAGEDDAKAFFANLQALLDD